MPDCYHVVSSEAEDAAKDIYKCIKEVGGPGTPHGLATDRAKVRVHSRVHYETWDLAEEYLDKLTECFKRKGHEVHHAEVIADFEEYGLAIPDYSPEPGSDTRAS